MKYRLRVGGVYPSAMQQEIKSTNECEWVKRTKKLLMFYLNQTGFEFEDECRCSKLGGDKRKRIDVAAFKDHSSIAFEIKRNEPDLLSLYGKNFIADYNYFVIPSELLFQTMRYVTECYEDIGVIIYDNYKDFYVFKHSKLRLENIPDNKWLSRLEVQAIAYSTGQEPTLPFHEIPKESMWSFLSVNRHELVI